MMKFIWGLVRQATFSRYRRTAAAVVGIVVSAACTSGAPLQSQAETVSLEPRPPKEWAAAVGFRFYDPLRADGENAWTTEVRFSDGSRTWTVSEDDLSTQGLQYPHTAWYRTRDTGTLSVEILLRPLSGQADTTRAQVEMPLKNDIAYEVFIEIRKEDPSDICMGCDGVASFPLKTREGTMSPDSLWITWGANPISYMRVSDTAPEPPRDFYTEAEPLRKW